jgi:hypothetical protein
VEESFSGEGFDGAANGGFADVVAEASDVATGGDQVARSIFTGVNQGTEKGEDSLKRRQITEYQ